jgi:hypothetical protein
MPTRLDIAENLDKAIYARIDRAELEDLIREPDEQNEEEQVDNEGEQVNEAEQVENEEKQVEHEDDQEAEDYQTEPNPVAELDEIQESNSDNDNRIFVEANDVPTVTDKDEASTQEPATTRSGRTITRPSRYNANQMKRMERKHLILHQTNKDHENHIEYNTNVAVVAAKTIESITFAVFQKRAAFAQQFILQKGFK